MSANITFYVGTWIEREVDRLAGIKHGKACSCCIEMGREIYSTQKMNNLSVMCVRVCGIKRENFTHCVGSGSNQLFETTRVFACSHLKLSWVQVVWSILMVLRPYQFWWHVGRSAGSIDSFVLNTIPVKVDLREVQVTRSLPLLQGRPFLTLLACLLPGTCSYVFCVRLCATISESRSWSEVLHLGNL